MPTKDTPQGGTSNPSTPVNPNPKPAVPIVITVDPDGTLHVGGLTIPASSAAALKQFWAGGDEIIVAPSPGPLLRLFLFCKGLIAASGAGDRMGTVNFFGSVFGSVCELIGLVNAPKISKKGAPSKSGIVAAAHATAAAVLKFATETANAHVNPQDINSQAADLAVWWTLATMLITGLEKISRNAIPEAKAVVEVMRRVLQVADPVLDTNHELAVALDLALRYLKDPHRKASKTRKSNKRKNKQLVDKTQAQALPQARDQARQEIKGQLADHLDGFLK